MRKKRSKKKNPYLRILFLLVLIVGLGIFGFKKVSHYKQIAHIEKVFAEELEPNTENKNYGEIKSILDYNTNYVVAVHYPKFKKEKIDREVFDFVDDHILSFKDNLKTIPKSKNKKDNQNISDLHIDYELFNIKDEIVSIKFNVKEEIKDLSIDNYSTKVFNYSLSDEESIKLDELLIEDGLKVISDSVYKAIGLNFNLENENKDEIKNITSDSFDNFDTFFLRNNSFIFKLKSNENISKEITNEEYAVSFEDLEAYLKYDLVTGKKLSEEEINEKIELIKNSGKVRPSLDPNKPMIALTFDDGPYRNITTPILDVLEKHNAAATFFILGNRVSGNEDIIQRAINGGSEIANHSFSHKQLTAISNNELKSQVYDTQAAIKNAVGREPTLLRPTYGAVNNNLKQTIDMPLILWSIDTLDWKHRNSQRIINHVLSNVRDGDIILMHDMYPTTNQATQVLVPELINRGFQLVTVTELYELKGLPLEGGKTYTNVR